MDCRAVSLAVEQEARAVDQRPHQVFCCFLWRSGSSEVGLSLLQLFSGWLPTEHRQIDGLDQLFRGGIGRERASNDALRMSNGVTNGGSVDHIQSLAEADIAGSLAFAG